MAGFPGQRGSCPAGDVRVVLKWAWMLPERADSDGDRECRAIWSGSTAPVRGRIGAVARMNRSAS